MWVIRPVLSLFQRLREIILDVVDMLNADTQTNGLLLHARFSQLFRRQLTVSG